MDKEAQLQNEENLNLQDQEYSQVYLCSGCGANMEFDISSQKLKCPYCNSEMDIDDGKGEVKEYDFEDVTDREASSEWNDEVTVIKCDACGAETVVEKYQTALSCSFCGSSHVLGSKQSAGIKPEGVIPFKIDNIAANGQLHKWIKRKWLAPNDLKKLFQSEKLKPVYVPYWTYDADTYNTWHAQGGKHYYVTVRRNGKNVRERRTRWYPVSGHFHKFFDDVQVNASKNYDEYIIRDIEPYNTREVESYKPQYLSGYTAERYSKNVKVCFLTAKDKIHGVLVDEVRQIVRRRYDEVRSIEVYPDYRNVKYKHVLLPLWWARYEYKNKWYTYMINGQTGEVGGESPLSPIKITLLIILVLVAVFAYLYLSGNLPISDAEALMLPLYNM